MTGSGGSQSPLPPERQRPAPEEPVKPSRFIDSANCAIEGILYAARTQRHMRYHFAAAVFVLFAALLLRVSAVEFTLLAVSICFVLFAELVNTAIEAVVDLVSPGYHPLAKVAKDVAAGGVMTAAVAAAVMGYFILSKYIFPVYRGLLGMIGSPSDVGTLVSVLLVVIAVIVLKARTGKGTPLQGGLPSGHAALAFSIATSITVSTRDPLVSILSISLAIMVSHSRLLLRIHTLREVIFGALTGTAVTLAVLVIFQMVG